MTSKQLDDRIKSLIATLVTPTVTLDHQKAEVHKLLSDVIKEIIPEHATADVDDTDERFHINLGFNEAIDTINERLEELLG